MLTQHWVRLRNGLHLDLWEPLARVQSYCYFPTFFTFVSREKTFSSCGSVGCFRVSLLVSDHKASGLVFVSQQMFLKLVRMFLASASGGSRGGPADSLMI